MGAVAVALALAGCSGAAAQSSSADPEPAAPSVVPGGTTTALAGAGSTVTPPAGYDVVVVADPGDPLAAGLQQAVEVWAQEVGAQVSTSAATDEDEVYAALLAAVQRHPDLVVGAGNGVVDQLAMVSPQVLDQEFLVLGAQLSEPTDNVTAVVWAGASFRGSGFSAPEDSTATTVTAERAAEAVDAGVATVLADETGVVVALG